MESVKAEIMAKVERHGASITGLEKVPWIVQARPLFDFEGVDPQCLKNLGKREDDLFEGYGLHNVAVFPDGRVEGLKTVSEQYQLVQHLDAINSTLDHIPPEFGLNKVQVITSPDGGRIWAKFCSKDNIEILPGDELTFQATLQNSADTSKVYRMLSQVLRLVCTNGLMVPDKRFDQVSIKKIHKGNMEIGDQVQTFFDNMDENLKAVGMWKRYANMKMETPQLEEVFDKLKSGPRVQDEILGLTLRGERTSVNHLLQNGNLNAWNVYGAFTQRLTDSDSLETVKINQGIKISEVFDEIVLN